MTSADAALDTYDVLETVYWDAGTARLLPRLFTGRTRGPGVRNPPPPGARQGRQPTRQKPESVRRYFKPSPEAIAELTSLLAPGGINR